MSQTPCCPLPCLKFLDIPGKHHFLKAILSLQLLAGMCAVCAKHSKQVSKLDLRASRPPRLIKQPISSDTYVHSTYRYIPTYIRTYMHAYIHASVRACMRTYIPTCMHACIHACMRACRHCIHACLHACMHTYTYMRVTTYATDWRNVI